MIEGQDIRDNINQNEPSSFKLISALGIAGLFSGVVLVGTFIYTNPMIIANKEAATQRAIFNVLPGCESFTTFILEEDKLQELSSDAEEGEGKANTLKVYAGYNNANELIGFAIPGSEPGFQDIIGAMFGYDGINKVVIGFEVLESKETPGLGDKIFKDQAFQTNFTKLSVEPEIIAVKNGEKSKANEIEAITGATISSKAVVRLINNTLLNWKTSIDTYIIENDLKIVDKDE